jgi:hypothetical protein
MWNNVQLVQDWRLARPMMWSPILPGIPGATGDVTLVIRGARNGSALALPVQKVLAGLDPELPVKQILTMEQVIGDTTSGSGFSATLAIAFAGLALLLAAGAFTAYWHIWSRRELPRSACALP